MKKAIIDLGTNTCNLLIAESNDKSNYILHTSKVEVKLGKGGINNNRLTKEATKRAVHALNTHLKSMKSYGKIDSINVIATSAVRDARNKVEFVQEIKKITGLELNIISGEKEAEYIFEGVKFALGKIPDGGLIMDIGGGSNEFIIVKDNRIVWKQSFPTGIARVVERFPISDPISDLEYQEIMSWFDKNMQELWEQGKTHEISTLIGCSGTFDTLVDTIDGVKPNCKFRKAQHISQIDFNRICSQLVNSTLLERLGMDTMEQMRVEMIVPAMLLIQLVMRKFSIQNIIQTDYSLKEGVFSSFINL
ncbi:MAG: phosphatase [Mangrovibacterium sp.]